ncbi:DNA mismatch repair protein msh2, partial [Globisporangium splendens]
MRMPGCVVAVALADGDANDGNRGIVGVLPRPALDEHAAVVCVVDLPALTISGHLLSAPPARAYKQKAAAVLSSSIDDPSDSIKDSPESCFDNSKATTIGTQLEALLQQLQWWREGNRRDTAAAHAGNDFHVTCLWSTRSSGDTGLRSEITRTIERAVDAQPVVRIVDNFFESDTEEHVEAQIGHLLAHPQALSAWKSEHPKQYRWLLLAANEILTHWQLYEETKLEGAFALELHTEGVEKHLSARSVCVVQLANTIALRHTESILPLETGKEASTTGDHAAFWIEWPCVDAIAISERHSMVSALLAISSPGTAETSQVYPCLLRVLTHFAPLEQTLKQFCGRTTWMQECLLIAVDFERLLNWLTQLSALLTLDPASEYTDEENVVVDCIIAPIKWLCHEPLAPFCQMISENLRPIAPTLNVDASVNTERIQTSARLHELNDQIQQCESEIERVKRQVASSLRLPAERVKIVYEDDSNASLRGLRVLLRVSRQDAHRVHQLRNSVASVLRTSKASGVLFSTSALDTLSATWKTLKQSYKETEEALVQQLSDVLASTYVRFLNELVDLIVEADILLGFASVSRERNFVRPRLTDFEECSWSLRIVNAVDPIPARGAQVRGYGEKRSAFDAELSSDSGKSFLVLSSEDAEANNSMLHAIGVIVMLNQIGCFVPCEFAELSVFDSALLRTGSYDQQLFGRSTFMTEMVEMRLIFSNMTRKSLVLIDDLCRGTSNGEPPCIHWFLFSSVCCDH